ncbi:GAF domain-containing hybrid sensor histidine kinase/response regulator [Pleionea litopenaei]|uniref:histidine kinase n=1 Tax=Pleionea litopenaei TaxID=3070815 RepID=A0AA51RQ59_9GAMM|nr:ATP-binding protein [Pleionea sp. HL-JVS1]WMS85551.1 ATP-binding protein [Pleionea sp. HL-JVS1]
MKKAEQHSQEDLRLEALYEYEILDTLPEQDFDDLTLLASQLCDVPIALVSLVDQHRQWFKSKQGLDVTETPRDLAFCAHAILQDDVMIVEDTLDDRRFNDNPLVIGEPNIRFYAGMPLKSQQGLPLGTLCIIDQKPRKLTKDQKNALSALSRQVMAQLELRLAVKRQSKAQEELLVLNQKLRSLAELKTKFLNHLSHEIRTPINGILGLSEQLCERFPVTSQHSEDSLEKSLHVIHCSAESLHDTVNHVLDISRIESGNMKRELMSVGLEKMIDELFIINQQRAKTRTITLRKEISQELPRYVELDKIKVMQILINLLGNAIKFTPEHEAVTVKVTQEQQQLKIQVIDSGVGIAQADLKNIFKPFHQVSNSLSHLTQGSGLGLTIVKELCVFLGGDVCVQSELNHGSTFTVTLPLKASKVTANERPKFKSMTQFKDKKILLIEDNRVNQMVIKGYLRDTGIDLQIAQIGNHALPMALAKMPDLILIDIRLPDMTGFEVIEQLNQQSDLQKVPKAFLSGDVSQETFDQAEALGAVEFLTKPLRREKLFEFLTALWDG